MPFPRNLLFWWTSVHDALSDMCAIRTRTRSPLDCPSPGSMSCVTNAAFTFSTFLSGTGLEPDWVLRGSLILCRLTELSGVRCRVWPLETICWLGLGLYPLNFPSGSWSSELWGRARLLRRCSHLCFSSKIFRSRVGDAGLSSVAWTVTQASSAGSWSAASVTKPTSKQSSALGQSSGSWAEQERVTRVSTRKWPVLVMFN